MVNPSWDQFERLEPPKVKENQVVADVIDQTPEQKSTPQWGDFQTPTTYQGEPDPTADEGMFEYITRNAISNASRVAEQVAGRFGNIEKFAKDTLVNMPKSGGILGWAVSELIGPEKWEKLIKGEGKQLLPTSEDLKKVSQGLTGGYTKPKTPGEEKFQEFTEDVGATISGRSNARVPGASNTERARQLATNHILIPAAANITKQVAQEVGFGEDIANMAKMAVWLPLSLANNINAPRHASNLMNEGRRGMPETLQFSVPRLLQRLQQVSQDPALLRADPRSALARQEIMNIQRDLRNGQTSVRSLMTTYDGINAAKRNRGMFDLSRSDQRFARGSIDRVRNAVRDEIMEAGASQPQALENWRSGLQAWAVIHESNSVSNWVKSVAKGQYAKILTGPAAGLFGVGAYGAYSNPVIAAPASAASAASYKTGQTLYRMWNSEPLRNYYWNAISAAQSENLPVFLNNYNKLNKGLEKEDSVTNKGTKTKKD